MWTVVLSNHSLVSLNQNVCIFTAKYQIKKMIELVNEYIRYYNEEGISIKIKELTPSEYKKSTLYGLFLDTVRF